MPSSRPLLDIRVNGEDRQVEPGTTAERLVRDLGHEPAAVAVERNGRILRRAELGETELAAGDRLEVVRFVQGGAPGVPSPRGRVYNSAGVGR